MSPELPCPSCGAITQFADSEVEGVEDGSVVCLSCRAVITETAFVIEVMAGKHDALVEKILEEDEEGKEDDE
jgi:transcription initiation factor TFIIIB Brf1 subunit/transcription initiation factor TFIIB